jgi:hypothetical protein
MKKTVCILSFFVLLAGTAQGQVYSQTEQKENPAGPGYGNYDPRKMLNLLWQPWELDSGFDWTNKGLKERANGLVTNKPVAQDTFTTGLVYKLSPGILFNILHSPDTAADQANFNYKMATLHTYPIGLGNLAVDLDSIVSLQATAIGYSNQTTNNFGTASGPAIKTDAGAVHQVSVIWQMVCSDAKAETKLLCEHKIS